MVVVTPQDALCKHCMALINTMDRLELELRQHRYTLTQHLKIKYKLGKFIMVIFADIYVKQHSSLNCERLSILISLFSILFRQIYFKTNQSA